MNEKKFIVKDILKKEKGVLYLKYLQISIIVLYLILFIGKEHGYIKYTEQGTVNIYSVAYAGMLIILAITSGLLMFWNNKLSKLVNKIVACTLFILSPVICYLILEEFHHNKFKITISSIQSFYIFLNFLILFIILLFILFITNSTKVAVIGLCLITSGFGIINYYVYSFRGIAIVASDIYSVQTAASVAGDYKFFIDFNLYFIFIASLFIITVASKLRGFCVFSTWKVRVLVTIVYLILVGIITQTFVFSNQLSNYNINVKLFRPHKAYKTYGSLLTTVRTIGYIMVDQPEDYNKNKIKKLTDNYELDEVHGKKPNIIVIMDEAFSDLKSINDFKTSEDYMPFIRSLDENTIKGNVYVSSFGGNTANTEFEFLTGNSMAFLPANSVPYQLFIKDKFPSLTYQLENQGYIGNIALHPYYPDGYNRRKVYPLMGFEQFITVENFNTDRLLRTRIPDEVDFERIIQEYERAKSQSSQPFFLFNVTMQNHSGYKVSDPNFITKIKIEDEKYYDENTQNYVSLIKYTDEAMEMLINYFEGVEEPTVIIFFGDHQPGLSQSWYNKIFGKNEEELTAEDLMIKYQVPFFAWANFDIAKETITDGISMNYLSSYIMDKIGIKLTKYQQYLLDLHTDVPIMNSLGYFGENGNFYEYDDKKSPYYERLEEYRNVQYNNMHDKGNRINDMFYLNQ